MAEETKSASPKSDSSAPAKAPAATASETQNGKGDAPRNCFSESYRSNFDAIDWSK